MNLENFKEIADYGRLKVYINEIDDFETPYIVRLVTGRYCGGYTATFRYVIEAGEINGILLTDDEYKFLFKLIATEMV